jgi:hypothetical protein
VPPWAFQFKFPRPARNIGSPHPWETQAQVPCPGHRAMDAAPRVGPERTGSRAGCKPGKDQCRHYAAVTTIRVAERTARLSVTTLLSEPQSAAPCTDQQPGARYGAIMDGAKRHCVSQAAAQPQGQSSSCPISRLSVTIRPDRSLPGRA